MLARPEGLDVITCPSGSNLQLCPARTPSSPPPCNLSLCLTGFLCPAVTTQNLPRTVRAELPGNGWQCCLPHALPTCTSLLPSVTLTPHSHRPCQTQPFCSDKLILSGSSPLLSLSLASPWVGSAAHYLQAECCSAPSRLPPAQWVIAPSPHPPGSPMTSALRSLRMKTSQRSLMSVESACTARKAWPPR